MNTESILTELQEYDKELRKQRLLKKYRKALRLARALYLAVVVRWWWGKVLS